MKCDKAHAIPIFEFPEYQGERTVEGLEQFLGLSTSLRDLCLKKLAETNLIDFREHHTVASMFADDILVFKPHQYITVDDISWGFILLHHVEGRWL